MPSARPLIAIVGPTAVGKSALGIHLAVRFGGEVVNGDSRQVYRGMDVGTAKPSLEDQSRVPHHLLDLRDPDQPFSLTEFLDLARTAFRRIHKRGRLPILVGGTGQYLWALLEGWQAPRVAPDPELRRRLEQEAATAGAQALHHRLGEVDAVAAARIDPHNLRRVIRALEVVGALGGPAPPARQRRPPYRSLVLGLTLPSRSELYRRIDQRVDDMLAAGWLDEVRGLLARGYDQQLPALSSMGYRELALHLEGQLTLDEAVRRIRSAHHRLARRQYTWFKPTDPRIGWIEPDGRGLLEAEAQVERLLANVDNGTVLNPTLR